MKNTTRNLLVAVGIISVLVAIGYFSVFQNIFGSSNTIVINEEILPSSFTGDIAFDNIEGTYETVYLGSLTSYDNSVEDRVIIFGVSNAGEARIKNTISGGSKLLMNSEAYGIGGGVKNNYIKSTFTFPKGTLTINCKTEATGEDYDSESHCGVEGNFDIWTRSTQYPFDEEMDYPKDETRTIILDKETELTFYLKTEGAFGGRSEASLIAIFNPTIAQEEAIEEKNKEEAVVEIILEPVECNANIECQSTCGTKIPTCEDGECYCGGEQVLIESSKKDYKQYSFYLIPTAIIGLLGLIIWQKLRSKPRRKRK